MQQHRDVGVALGIRLTPGPAAEKDHADQVILARHFSNKGTDCSFGAGINHGRCSWVVVGGSFIVVRGSWVVGRGAFVVGRGSWGVDKCERYSPYISVIRRRSRAATGASSCASFLPSRSLLTVRI